MKIMRVVIDKIISIVKTTLYDSSGDETGVTGNPLVVTPVASGGGTVTANVNLHDDAGVAYDDSNPLSTKVTNPSTGYSTTAKQDVANAILATIDADTGSIDSKITACDTGAVTVAASALPTGASTSALQTAANLILTAISEGVSIDSSTTGGAIVHEGMLGTTSEGHLIGEGLVPGHKPFLRLGYNPEVSNVEETIWSAGGSYVWPTAEMGMEVVSGSADDTGTSIHSGTSTGGSTTTLVDTGADFTAGLVSEAQVLHGLTTCLILPQIQERKPSISATWMTATCREKK